MSDRIIIPSLADVIRRDRSMVDACLAEPHRSFVFHADGTMARAVTNLGWLLRHRGDVLHPLQGIAFRVMHWRYGPASVTGSYGYSPIDGRPHPGHLPIIRHAPILLARMVDGRHYGTAFADPSVLLDWIDRPSWRGYLLDWDARSSSVTCVIGAADFRAIDPASMRGGN